MKVATIFLKYDYGIEKRGISGEKKVMLPAIESQVDEVVTFWLEENGYPSNMDGLQKKIIEFCEKKEPNIVFFILMNDEVRKETLRILSEKYITINWFCDDQWRFDSFSRFVAPYLHYSVTMDKYSVNKFRSINSKVILSQWATNDYAEKLSFDKIEYKYDISFIGGKNPTREWYIEELRKSGYVIECFGNGWSNGRVSFEDMNEIFKISKINLNLSNSSPVDFRFYKFFRTYLIKELFKNIVKVKNKSFKRYIKDILRPIYRFFNINKMSKNIEQMKARNFEIPGSGGFQLSQYAPELEDYYEIGKEIAIFTNIDELKLNIDYYLKNENRRIEIAKAGHNRTKNYTYNKRMNEIFKEVAKCEKLV